MKKIIAIAGLAVSCATTSSFSQGYLQFVSSKSEVYDGFTTPGVYSTANSTVDVALLWASANTVPTLDGYLTSVPITTTSGMYESFMVAQAWSAILSGQFNLATNNNTGSLVEQLTGSFGNINYNSGGAFPVAGTTVGSTYTFYMIGWDANYATPALAAAANGGLGAAVGWSAPFQITLVSSTDPSGVAFPNFQGLAATRFGTIYVVPEPAAITLATLGGISLPAFRHRRKVGYWLFKS